MLHEIHNESLTVAADELGAQLMSVRSAKAEYLWQGDPAYWRDRALNLFPFVARLWQGEYEMDGRRYAMPIHGFAPESRFALAEKTDSRMVFEIRADAATRAQYPREFVFRVIYALDGARLHTTYEVRNEDARAMYFGLGGHPGLNVPLEPGLTFEDYRLRFAPGHAPVRVGFSSDCFVDGGDMPFPLEGDCLPLRHDLFDDDAIVLRGMARVVTLESPRGMLGVTVSYPDMPYLGIWHMPRTDAPYVCIEPWLSLPAKRGEVTVFEEKRDLVRLEPGQGYTNTFTIEIHE